MQKAWDLASTSYLAARGNDVTSVSYGNLAPSEAELQLLGEVRGKRILDIGCGGGQNAVACVLAGATVVGVDVSAVQLAAAQRLAAAYDVDVQWLHGDVATLDMPSTTSFDLVLAIQTLPYVADPAGVLRHSSRWLGSGGELILSLDHPLRACFFDEEVEEFAAYPVRSYFAEGWLHWRFDNELPMRSQQHALGAWLGWVAAAGLMIQRVVEAPAPEALCDELWPEDSPLAPLRNVPHTAIIVAQKVD